MSGGLLLGAIFMATDYTTSPITKKGKVIFGISCGIVTVLIRFYAALPEGVSYAILLMNILVPHSENLTIPKVFGEEAKVK
jgi:electron transport complex protein RnfD